MRTFVPWSSQCFLAYVFLVDVRRDGIFFSRNKSVQWDIILSILFKKKSVCKNVLTSHVQTHTLYSVLPVGRRFAGGLPVSPQEQRKKVCPRGYFPSMPS